MDIPAKENEIKARFDDETLDRILAQCRKQRKRRAVLVREIVERWLDEEERKATSAAA
jgi:predicted DNA-binding protein|uniref:Ribbon-helix-helix protein CopG domain-containing protein n=1 Tax=Ectopseudomonas oleovorans TaxID=301 RepID=A0A653B1N1_ECTOL